MREIFRIPLVVNPDTSLKVHTRIPISPVVVSQSIWNMLDQYEMNPREIMYFNRAVKIVDQLSEEEKEVMAANTPFRYDDIVGYVGLFSSG
jgi:hypothetical protein